MIEENVSLHDKNWFRTGGPARYFCAAKSAQDIQEALALAEKHQLKVHVLGDGANTLLSDNGFDGLIIQPAMQACTVKPTSQSENTRLIRAEAGARVQDVVTFCLEHQLLGLEELSGIPGTVGGSVYNNLHYFEFSLSDFVDHACIIDCTTGQTSDVSKEWLGFGYDHSSLHAKKHILLSATFRLKKATELETAFAKGRSAEIIRHRLKRYPHARTCGCFFRNFLPDELKKNNHTLPYVAYYLDLLGVKGTLRHGGASVSSQHANMIVTTESATSADIVAVARTMQERVFEKFGLLPQPECELVGFAEYPLKK